MTMREKIARALCEVDGYDPDALEPGDEPYMDNRTVIDGYNAKGEACHLFWRRWDRKHVDAVLDALREPDEAMVEAAKPWPKHWSRNRDSPDYPMMVAAYRTDQLAAITVWQAMIDAALKDPETSA